ncbi:MAG: ankyrin repeat domain-containing protein [Coxiellaceae bacterium]|nr:MAG: ankyrin repeat domain-containing protein [Coxiellaceae bacterium]
MIGKLLLGTGANKEIVNNSSNTPTSIAVINNQLSMVILLLDHKFEQSDVEIEQGPSNVNDSPVKNIPLHQAIWRDDKDMVSLLVVKHENINTVNEQGHASLHISVLSKNKWMISFFLNVGAAVDIQDSKGRTPLHLVVEMDDVELVKIFSEHNKKALNVKDIDGHTPLHKAAIYGHFAVFKALLKAGADLDCPDDAGAFTIHLAISHGQTRIADFLIEKYPNLMMARDHRGLTPLCITIMHSQKAIFNRLIAQGAQLEVMDIQGRLWTIDKQWENNAVLRTGLNTATYGNLPLQFTRDWFFNSTPELQQARQKFLLDFVGTNRAESLDKKLMVFLQQLFVKFRRDPDEIIKPTKAVFSNDTIDGSYPVYKENRRSVPVAIVRRLVLDLLLDPVYDPYQHRQLIYAFFVVYDQYQKGNRSQHYAGELALYHLYRDCLEAPDLYFSSDFDKMRRHCEAELKAAFNATLSPTLLLMHNDSFYQKNHLSLSILTRIGDELMRLHNNNAALSEYLYQIYIARLERQVTIRADFVNNAAVWSRIRKEGLSNKEEKIKEQVLGIMQQCMIAICESNASRLEKTKALITIFKVTGKSLDKWFYDQAHFHRLIDFSSSRYSSFYSFNLYQALVWAKESDFSKIHHRYQDSIEWAFMVASINLGFHFGHDIFYKNKREFIKYTTSCL